jgi:hypothetical protein
MSDSPTDLDAPTPPGGPQRTDAPDGSASPGRAGGAAPEPEVHAGTAADESSSDVTPEPTADGTVHATSQADQVNEELQEENAETALDQPSDGSGGE